MEHMILWATCTLIVMLAFFGMSLIDVQLSRSKPEEDEREPDRTEFGKRAFVIIFASILFASPIWGFFELVYWVFT